MNFPSVFKEFVKFANENHLAIYNEFSLQFELSFYLRQIFGKKFKVQLERNVTFLGLQNTLIKKEIDILIYRDIEKLKDVIIIELKAVIEQDITRPITVFNWIKDLRFLEQLKLAGVGGCYSLFVTDNEKFFSNRATSNIKSRHLLDFQKRKVDGNYSSHHKPNKKSKTISLNSEYTFQWKNFVNGQKYFLIAI